MKRAIKPIVRKIKKSEERSDFAYWQTRTPEERLDALEEIRKEYNGWKYGSKQRFQRVYRIIKRK